MAELFPFADLLDAAGGVSVNGLAREIGKPRRTVHRWRQTGAVPASSADQAAVALGHHPAEIWPSWGTDTPWSDDE